MITKKFIIKMTHEILDCATGVYTAGSCKKWKRYVDMKMPKEDKRNIISLAMLMIKMHYRIYEIEDLFEEDNDTE